MALWKKKNKELGSGTDEAEMSFLDHLEELRWHIMRSLISIVVVAIVVFLFRNIVFDKVILGPTRDSFFTYRFFCDNLGLLCFGPQDLQLITKELGEQFFCHIRVSLWLGLIVSFPLVFNEIWKFIKPGLHSKERKVTRGVVFTCSMLFISGVSFGYFVVAPFAITFLSNYSVSPDIANTITLRSLVSYMTMFTLPTGLVFELPIVVFFLAKLGLLYPSMMRTYRKHSIIIILGLSAIITPPDVVTQFLIGIPLYILYEISIIICARTNPDPKTTDS